MKNLRNYLSLFPVILLLACASQTMMVKNSSAIKAGMLTSELRELMGEPQNRQFEGNNEAWQYCSTDYSGFETDHYVLVWIVDETVTGMQTYRNAEIGMCGSFFRTVNWEDAPDASIEVRNR